MLQFLRRRDPAFADQARILRLVVVDALRDRLGLEDDAVIRVTEVACSDPDCPDAETIAILLRPGRRSEAAKVPRSMRSLDGADLDDLAAQLAAKGGLPEARR